MAKRILLCDDEFHIVRAAEIKFQRRGFDVRTASDGEEAWEILQEWLPDVLVTDCQMPRLDGLGLVERLRQHESTAHLPVLMLSAKCFEKQYRDTAEALGILGVMAKPFSPRELLIRVEQIVELAHAADRPLAVAESRKAKTGDGQGTAPAIAGESAELAGVGVASAAPVASTTQPAEA